MTNIEQKAVQHVLRTIASIDTYPIYSALSKALIEANIEDTTKATILDKYNKAMEIQILKVREAQGWLEAIITDSKK